MLSCGDMPLALTVLLTCGSFAQAAVAGSVCDASLLCSTNSSFDGHGCVAKASAGFSQNRTHKYSYQWRVGAFTAGCKNDQTGVRLSNVTFANVSAQTALYFTERATVSSSTFRGHGRAPQIKSAGEKKENWFVNQTDAIPSAGDSIQYEAALILGKGGGVKDCYFVDNANVCRDPVLAADQWGGKATGGPHCASNRAFAFGRASFGQQNWGGALKIWDGPGDAVVSGCSFMSNTAGFYNGRAAWNGRVTMYALDNRGGAVMAKHRNLSILGSAFVKNEIELHVTLDAITRIRNGGHGVWGYPACCSEDGGAVYIDGPSGFTAVAQLTQCSFQMNSGGSGNGGAVAVTMDAAAVFEHCEFTDNKARNGGALHATADAGMRVVSCTFRSNRAHHALVDDPPAYADSFGWSTDFGATQGGAIYSSGGAGLSLSSCAIDRNVATEKGGALLLEPQALALTRIESCSFLTNTVTESGSTTRTGAVFVSRGAGLVVAACKFRNNTAAPSDQSSIRSTDVGGGAITATAAKTNMTACTFQRNRGISGGAVSAVFDEFALEDSWFESNNATVFGGAIRLATQWATGLLALTNTTFERNEAEYGGAIYRDSDDLPASGVETSAAAHGLRTVAMHGCVFRHNVARSGWGSLFWSRTGTGGNSALANFLRFKNSSMTAIESTSSVFFLDAACVTDGHSWLEIAGVGLVATNPCPIGHFCVGSKMTPCPPGTYNDATMQSVCRLCAKGRFNAAEYGRNRTCEACGSGTIAATMGQVACTNCTVEGFVPNDATDKLLPPVRCVACKLQPGMYVPKGMAACGYLACDVCAAGKVMTQSCENGTNRACGDCAVGTFSASPNEASCTTCPPGEFQPASGKFACEICPEGFVGVSSGGTGGATYCTACGAGRFARAQGMSACDDCMGGRYQDSSGAATCLACPTGHAHDPKNATVLGVSCTTCPTGHYVGTPGSVKCSKCDVDSRMYAAVSHGASECFQCADNAVTVMRHAMPGRPGPLYMQTCECQPGYYEPLFSLDPTRTPNATYGALACAPCEIGATCNEIAFNAAEEESIDFEGRLATRQGYWRQRDWRTLGTGNGKAMTGGDAKETFLPCEQPLACEGTANFLLAVKDFLQYNASDPTARLAVDAWLLKNNTEIKSQCRPGHTGVICALCEEGYRLDGRQLCEDCRGSTATTAAVVKGLVFTVLSVLVCAVMTCILVMSPETNSNDEQPNEIGEKGKKKKGRQSHRKTKTKKRKSVHEATEKSIAKKEDANTALEVCVDVFNRFAVMLPHLQRIASLNDVFRGITWPPFVTQVLRIAKLLIMQFGTLFAFISPCTLGVSVEQEMIIALCVVPWVLAVGAFAKLASTAVIHGRHAGVIRQKQVVSASSRGKKETAKEARKRIRSARKARATAKARKKKKLPAFVDIEAGKHTASVRLLALYLLGGKFGHPGISQQLLEVGVCLEVDGKYVMRTAVNIECSMADKMYDKLVIMSIVGTVLITMAMPLIMAAVIYNDRRHAFAEARIHAAEQENDRSAEMRSLLHASTQLDRIKNHVHTWRQRRVLAFEQTKHRSVKWFTAKWKPSYWWWFLVEMLFSLIIISLLQLVASNQGMQYYTALIAAALQVLLPALLRPHVERIDDDIAIVAGITYFLLVVSRLPRIFLDLAMIKPNFDLETHKRQVDAANYMMDVTFMLCLLVLLGLMLQVLVGKLAALLWEKFRVIVSPARKKRRVAVAPAIGEKQIKQRKGNFFARKKTNVAEHKAAAKSDLVVPDVLRRCRPHVLEAAGAALHAEYDQAWRRVAELQTSVMATSIQSVMRGKLERKKFAHILAEVAAVDGKARENKAQDVAATVPPPQHVIQVKIKARNSHRALMHSREDTADLLDKLRAFEKELKEGNNSTEEDALRDEPDSEAKNARPARQRLVRNTTFGVSSQKLHIVSAVSGRVGHEAGTGASKVEQELLDAAAQFSAAELSGLHEEHRITDEQMVALMALQHEAEHAERRALHHVEKKKAIAAGRKKRLKSRMSHALKQSGLTLEEARESFEACDVNKDGMVSVEELMQLEVLRPYLDIGSAGKVDIDDEAQLKRAEAIAALSSLVSSADADGDPLSLTWAEFEKILFPGK